MFGYALENLLENICGVEFICGALLSMWQQWHTW